MSTPRCPLPGTDFNQPGLDAVFYSGQGLGLAAPPWYPAERLEAHLAQCLLRDPHDLSTHLRRVGFWLDQPGSAGLAAALTDLCLVFGEPHGKLRNRLLAMAGDRLPAALRDYLRTPCGAPPIDLPDSLFARGPAYPGGPDFIGRAAGMHDGAGA